MVLEFAECLRKVAVKQRFVPEAESSVGMRVASASDVVPCVNELEVGIFRSAEESHRGSVFDITHQVFLDLPRHFFSKVGGVKGFKNLLNEVLLIRSEEGVESFLGADVPPVADEIPFWVIDWEANALALRVRETFVKLHGQRIRGNGVCRREDWSEGGAREEAEDVAAGVRGNVKRQRGGGIH